MMPSGDGTPAEILTPLQNRVASAWKELFMKPNILLDDDFFDLGNFFQHVHCQFFMLFEFNLYDILNRRWAFGAGRTSDVVAAPTHFHCTRFRWRCSFSY
jgi:hypothetical protein